MNEWMQRIERLEQASRAAEQARHAAEQAQRAAEQARHAAERRAHRWQAATGLLLALGLVLLPLQGGTAQGGGLPAGGLPALQNRVAVLETTVAGQVTQSSAVQRALTDEARTREAGDLQLQGEIDPLAIVLERFSAENGGDDIVITGANLHLRNGLGATWGNPADINDNTTNGLGNLIVGYNENPFEFARTGSHNIVVGMGHGWKSWGGLVVGLWNRITGRNASVTGGVGNLASGSGSSVSGGGANIASGGNSSVSGGNHNTASGYDSSVGGGFSHNQGGQEVWQGGTLVSGP
jgi:hypothetical protein